VRRSGAALGEPGTEIAWVGSADTILVVRGFEIRFRRLAATLAIAACGFAPADFPWRLGPCRCGLAGTAAAPLHSSGFYALPGLSMLMRSVNDSQAGTLRRKETPSQYASLTGDPVFLKVFSNTLYTSL